MIRPKRTHSIHTCICISFEPTNSKFAIHLLVFRLTLLRLEIFRVFIGTYPHIIRYDYISDPECLGYLSEYILLYSATIIRVIKFFNKIFKIFRVFIGTYYLIIEYDYIRWLKIFKVFIGIYPLIISLLTI